MGNLNEDLWFGWGLEEGFRRCIRLLLHDVLSLRQTKIWVIELGSELWCDSINTYRFMDSEVFGNGGISVAVAGVNRQGAICIFSVRLLSGCNA